MDLITAVVSPPRQEHIDVLKKHFGHSEFRPTQWDIIYSVLEVSTHLASIYMIFLSHFTALNVY